MVQLEALTAKYGKRYPEAVRSLAEEEEHTLTFYAFPPRCTGTFRPPMRSRVSEAMCANAPIRLTSSRRRQLPDDCVGHYRGHPLA